MAIMKKFKSYGYLRFAIIILFSYIQFGNRVQCSKPWEPEAVLKNKWWNTVHETHLNTTIDNIEENKIRVIFFGDSLTHLWTGENWGQSIWNREYVPIGAVNYGIGGDKTQNLLWRIQTGGVEKLVNPPPKLIVLCIGTNNIHKNTTDEEISKGVEAIVTTLRDQLPETKILLLGLFPRDNIWFGARVANINLQIARLDKDVYGRVVNGSKEVGYGKMLKFFDMWTHFYLSLGQVVPEYFHKDKLHLNTNGYEKWAQLMNDTFIEMLQD